MSTDKSKVIDFPSRSRAKPRDERLCTRDYTGHVGKIYTQIWWSGDVLWGVSESENLTLGGLKERVLEEADAVKFVMQESISGMEALYERSKKEPYVADPRSISFTVAVERAVHFVDWLQEMVAGWEKNFEGIEAAVYEVREVSFEMSGDDPAWAVILKIHADSQKKPA
ncbi:hypothetical protein B9Y88_07490 [Stenotrophomonas maltophilia]|uniref:hypothetical protein n=1 Tax=Stenotrophomonas TaxID=40323 RepID=UPI000C2687BD|nr:MULTISPECIES: hypothetical protein [unclassified Stenotrophomonas]MCU1059694.1 hypothetical protein [Stenotrophomonas maltophilia]MDH1242545.1 hypothetical protein [Stenotrophomonas sp. GD03948]MDH1577107.1 hypothetical protein [Stenotrophomonas sp. GD03744]PJL78583.1 hypothetical protein B9Y88_07490 [Stenotrophomonas maltophilia]PZT38399.1 hypothetical protein A7X94_06430 [Stenotrophomonas maltophilia]